MSEILRRVIDLVRCKEVRISAHGYDELAEDGILASEVVDGVADAVVVEDYPEYALGPCTLVLQHDRNNGLIHAVWGIAKGRTSPAVLITAYRPNPARWSDDFLQRRQ